MADRLSYMINSFVGDPKTDSVIQELWQQIATAMNKIPEPLSRSDVTNIAKSSAIGSKILHGNHADRPIPESLTEGSLFIEDDRNAVYLDKSISGALAWVFILGIMRGTLSPNQKPADLGVNDTGFLFYSTDFEHSYRWSGAAWAYTSEDEGNGYFRFYGKTPPKGTWQLCNGSANIVESKNDGSTGLTAIDGFVAGSVPDFTTASYVKAGIANALSPSAESGVSGDASPTTQSSSTGVTVAVDSHGTALAVLGAGNQVLVSPITHIATVTDPGHTHTVNAHNHGPGSLELRRTQMKCYYRL